MYPAFSKWISSHRQLPMRLNQWCNIVRWEFKDPIPFLRSREFLWQEGHTVHSNIRDCLQEQSEIVEIYKRVYQDLLAVPVFIGHKSKLEQFSGADSTMTLETMIQKGEGMKSIQAATVHVLGQNFSRFCSLISRMFDITFEDSKGLKQFPFQNSWGLTTRSIGIMILTHGDDKGLVLPPFIAPTQVVIIPIGKQNKDSLFEKCRSLEKVLKNSGVRCIVDCSSDTPGYKFNHYERQGIPLRIEIGQKELLQNSMRTVMRHSSLAETLSLDDAGVVISQKLQNIHNNMLTRAKSKLNGLIQDCDSWQSFEDVISQGKVAKVSWCGECDEGRIKATILERTGKSIKSLLVEECAGTVIDAECFHCQQPLSKARALFGQSY